MKVRKFEKGERYRPIVTIEKIRKGIPTVIKVSGRRYVFDPGTVRRMSRKRSGTFKQTTRGGKK